VKIRLSDLKDLKDGQQISLSLGGSAPASVQGLGSSAPGSSSEAPSSSGSDSDTR
jgi:hypothetical protein